ncbi:endo-1,4-beta-xylanase [Hirschia litorea]|uniref:Beta-xylanase n=1 Tax=Hirschia litorea TaxID=1199156 RepID=A0ABW2IPR2_9PROT
MKYNVLVAAIAALGLTQCAQTREVSASNSATLAHAYEDHFLIGAALNEDQIYQRNAEIDAIIRTQFNSIVAENCMKFERIHPNQGGFFWDEADAFIAYGEKHDMAVIGHTLAWHSQTPEWLFLNDEGDNVGREELLKRMEHHITTIMHRYKGKVKGWDVVNEAVLDDGTMRQSKFYQIIGEDWVEQMFRIAQKADPDAELYYNDYSMAIPAKREAVHALVKGMQEKGIRVDGVGMQGHISLEGPTIDEYEASLVRLAELGLVMITELDVTVLPWPGTELTAEVSMSVEFQNEFNPYKDKLPADVSNQLTQRYKDMFALFLKHEDKIDRVTMWGVTDGATWRNDWPMEGRTDYPLLFDRANKAKPAVAEIISLTQSDDETSD